MSSQPAKNDWKKHIVQGLSGLVQKTKESMTAKKPHRSAKEEASEKDLAELSDFLKDSTPVPEILAMGAPPGANSSATGDSQESSSSAVLAMGAPPEASRSAAGVSQESSSSAVLAMGAPPEASSSATGVSQESSSSVAAFLGNLTEDEARKKRLANEAELLRLLGGDSDRDSESEDLGAIEAVLGAPLPAEAAPEEATTPATCLGDPLPAEAAPEETKEDWQQEVTALGQKFLDSNAAALEGEGVSRESCSATAVGQKFLGDTASAAESPRAEDSEASTAPFSESTSDSIPCVHLSPFSTTPLGDWDFRLPIYEDVEGVLDTISEHSSSTEHSCCCGARIDPDAVCLCRHRASSGFGAPPENHGAPSSQMLFRDPVLEEFVRVCVSRSTNADPPSMAPRGPDLEERSPGTLALSHFRCLLHSMPELPPSTYTPQQFKEAVGMSQEDFNELLLAREQEVHTEKGAMSEEAAQIPRSSSGPEEKHNAEEDLRYRS